MAENGFALAAREKKVAALVEAIDAHGYAGIVNHMEPIHWETLAKSAGVNPPSAETIQMVRNQINARIQVPQ